MLTHIHTHTPTYTHTHNLLRAVAQKKRSKPQRESRPGDTQVSLMKIVQTPQELPKADSH